MKDKTYMQCRLGRGGVTYVAWIPARFAVVGKTLEINGKSCVVLNVWEAEDGDYLLEHERDFKTAFPSLL